MRGSSDYERIRPDRLLHLCRRQALAAAPVPGDWRPVGAIEHVFTHFALTLDIWRCDDGASFDGANWTPAQGLGVLPSVFLKAARAGLDRLV